MATNNKNLPARTRGRPKLNDINHIQETILDMALAEFLEMGYGAASITKIVTKAKMSKTTVYSRFPSKQALFQAIVERQIAQIAPANIFVGLQGKLELETGLNLYANNILKLSLKDEFIGLNRLVISECHRFPELASSGKRRNELGIKRISSFIEQCLAVEGKHCKNVENVASVFIATIRGWYYQVLITDQIVTPSVRKKWVAEAVRLFLAGKDNW